MSEPDGKVVVDARGHRCPVPSLRLRRALEAASPGAVITLIADDPMARIDVPHLCAQLAARLLSTDEDAGVLMFRVTTPVASR